MMIEATPRGRMSEKRRQHIFSENCIAHHVALCCNCGRPIHRHNDAWMIEHKRALGLLGPDTNPNCGPSHVECGRVKTATQDIPSIAKAKRQHAAGTVRAFPKAEQVKKRKPARAFQVPAGVVFDWRLKRYARAASDL